MAQPAFNTSLGEVLLPTQEFEWEKTVSHFFYSENGWHNTFLLGSLLYVPVVFLTKKLMTNLDPVPSNVIKPFLLLWNIWMMIFSLIGAYYTLPDLISQFQVHNWSLKGQVCDNSCYNHPSAVWIFVFMISKMMEWVDTLFLLLEKKPIIFLHWFHHIVTMLYCWHASIYSTAVDCSAWWFATMNLIVHTIMYGYYGMRSFYSMRGKRFKLFSPLYITILQLLQMVIGVYITAIAYIRCDATRANNTWGTVFAGTMYGIYFYLFLQLFMAKKKHLKKPSKKTA